MTVTRLKPILPLLLLLLAPSVFAQTDTTLRNGQDLIDLFHRVTHKRKATTFDTCINKTQLHWSVVPAIGYTLQNGFAGVLSANNSFYYSRAEHQNMSTITGSVAFTQKNQFTLTIQPNIWTRNNKLNLVGDYRFFIYPQLTYGLGGYTSLSNETQINYNLARISQVVYFNVHKAWYAGIGYSLNDHYNIAETVDSTAVVDGGLVASAKTDFKTYDGAATTVSSGLSLDILYDERQNQNNPVAGGSYLSVQFTRYAMALGSTSNWNNLVVDARRYIGVGRGVNKLAFWTYGWFTFGGDAPYLDLPSTGWDTYNNLGRGYIQSRFRGKSLLYSEAEYRFNLTHNHLLGGVLFANAQSVTDYPNNQFSVLHPGMGGGIRIKFNKHSDTNIALDYAFGTDGSKGVFVNLGEVF